MAVKILSAAATAVSGSGHQIKPAGGSALTQRGTLEVEGGKVEDTGSSTRIRIVKEYVWLQHEGVDAVGGGDGLARTAAFRAALTKAATAGQSPVNGAGGRAGVVSGEPGIYDLTVPPGETDALLTIPGGVALHFAGQMENYRLRVRYEDVTAFPDVWAVKFADSYGGGFAGGGFGVEGIAPTDIPQQATPPSMMRGVYMADGMTLHSVAATGFKYGFALNKAHQTGYDLRSGNNWAGIGILDRVSQGDQYFEECKFNGNRYASVYIESDNLMGGTWKRIHLGYGPYGIVCEARLAATADTTNGSNQLTNAVATQGVFRKGLKLTGTGIPAGTTVTNVSGGTITMSNNATATGTGVTVQVAYTAGVDCQFEYVAFESCGNGMILAEGRDVSLRARDWTVANNPDGGNDVPALQHRAQILCRNLNIKNEGSVGMWNRISNTGAAGTADIEALIIAASSKFNTLGDITIINGMLEAATGGPLPFFKHPTNGSVPAVDGEATMRSAATQVKWFSVGGSVNVAKGDVLEKRGYQVRPYGSDAATSPNLPVAGVAESAAAVNEPVIVAVGGLTQPRVTPAAVGTGDTTSGSNQITNVSASSGTFAKGQAIRGTGIPSTAVIVDFAGGTITMSANATATGTGVAVTARVVTAADKYLRPKWIAGSANADRGLTVEAANATFTGDLTSGSNQITNVAVSDGTLWKGQILTGYGISTTGSRITAISGTTVTMSANATQTATAVPLRTASGRTDLLGPAYAVADGADNGSTVDARLLPGGVSDYRMPAFGG